MISAERGVTAAIVEQRPPVAGGTSDNPTEHDSMIPAGILRVALAYDVRQSAVQEDQSFRVQVVPDSIEAILVLVGKPSGQPLLRTREHVDDKFGSLDYHTVQVGFMIDANGD
jgi:hypothetical protein